MGTVARLRASIRSLHVTRRLLHAVHGSGITGRSQLVDTVLHQADLNTIATRGSSRSVSRGQLRIAHAHHVNAVDRDVVLLDEIANDGVRHRLRVANASQ